VKEILDVEPAFIENGDFAPEDALLKGDISFNRISFAYEKEEAIFRDLSFHIPAGKVTAIVGPSGVGKTTICHLMMRLFDPDNGCITLDGTDLKEFKLEWLRNQIALVSQEPFLFHSTVLENIRFSNPGADDAAVIEASKAACIHDYIQTLTERYHTVVGDRGVRLSGGQKQRISIARAILLDPKILILDEATAFLDATVEARLKKTVQLLMESKTIIIISHRPSTIESADKIIELGQGELLYEGPTTGYLRNGHSYCDYRQRRESLALACSRG
jgi:ABC-type multidrug transport system fused ATPase/permease subunit